MTARITTFASIAIPLVGIACAIWLGVADYPLGLDFIDNTGGTMPWWQGPTLPLALAVISAVVWVGALAVQRPGTAVVAVAMLGFVTTLVVSLVLGGTYAQHLYFAGVLQAFPIALAASLAARAAKDDPVTRLRTAWPAAVAFAIVVIASIVATAFDLDLDGTGHVIMVGLKFTRVATPVVAILAVLAALAVPRPEPIH